MNSERRQVYLLLLVLLFVNSFLASEIGVIMTALSMSSEFLLGLQLLGKMLTTACELVLKRSSLLPDDDNDMGIESQDEEDEEVPSRVVTSEVVVNVRAQVDSFDYEGLSDGHSVQTLLSNIAPRHLVLAYGSRQV